MSYDKVIHGHYDDLNNLSSLLRNYIEIYRLLISSTSELNSTSISRKSQLKHSVERIDNVGDIIDELLRAIKKCEGSYIRYCALKNDVIIEKTEKEKIQNEIHNEIHDDLEYHNNEEEKKL